MKLNKKTIAVILSVFSLLLVVFTVVVCIQKSHVSSVTFEVVSVQENEADKAVRLAAKDSNARRGIIKDTGSARFSFSQAQKESFLQIYKKTASAALVVRMEFTPTAAQKELLTTGTALPFNLGILYNEDFDSHNKLKEPLTSKITVYADLSKKLSYADTESVIIDFSMALPKSEHFESFLPQGFFISSSVACRILTVCAAPALIGLTVQKIPCSMALLLTEALLISKIPL